MKLPLIALYLLLYLLGCGPNADEQQAYQVLQQTLERSQKQINGEDQWMRKLMHRMVAKIEVRQEDIIIQN